MRKPVFISSIFFLFILGCSFDPTGLAYLEDSSVNNLPDADTDGQADADGSNEDIEDIQDINDADEDGDISCTTEDTTCLDFNQLQLCTTDGNLITVNCEFGCNDQVTPNACLDFIPSNNIDLNILLNQDLETTTFDLNASFNTDNGEIIMDGTPFREAGEGMDPITGIHFEIHDMADETQAGVFSFNILTVNEGAIVDVYGSKSIIIRANSLFLKGIIDVSASNHKCNNNNNRCAGPGGFSGGSANSAGNGPGKGYRGEQSWGSGDETGGGGAGYLTTGGSGGGSDGGDGGNIYGNDLCEPLTGGSGGGGGGHVNTLGNTDTNQGRGGGGGGAIQVTIKDYLEMGNSTVDPCGINANAAGGSGNDFTYNSGGGGGGAGGAVILESPRIRIYSNVIISANGGGGGAGRKNQAGAAGLFSQDPAPGADCSDCNRGGDGAAALATTPGNGDNNEDDDGTGGGGGSMGRIIIYDCIDFMNNGILSPTPVMGGCRLTP
ncbi:MAG: hypothetical protein ACQES9_08400 [Myxococcota bacterium]